MTKEPIHCLIVESSHYIADFLKEDVYPSNLDFTTATNLAEAKQTLAKKNIDIIIADLSETERDGLVQTVTGIFPYTLIVIIDSFASILSAVSMMKQGVFDYLGKPITKEVFKKIIQKALDQVEILQDGKIPADISQFWRIGNWNNKNLFPDSFFAAILETGIKIAQGERGALFLHLEDGSLQEAIRKEIDCNLALKTASRALENWAALPDDKKPAEILFPVNEENQEKILAVPFPGESKPTGVLIIQSGSLPLDEITSTFLSTFCSQTSPILKIGCKIVGLIRSKLSLEKIQEELMQSSKLASVGELAASIAHDINTPLTCIIGFIRLYLRFLDKPDVSLQELISIRHYLERACSESERCQEILKNLLLFSRKGSKKYVPFSLAELMERIYPLVEKEFLIHKVSIVKNIPSSLPSIMGNANQIQQVIMNMFINAKNAMAQGGTITIRAESFQNKVKIDIIDTGKGISKENLSRIFEPFFTTDTAGKGTGLGLSISKKIIQEHGGEIQVQSEVGQGTTFTLLLPQG